MVSMLKLFVISNNQSMVFMDFIFFNQNNNSTKEKNSEKEKLFIQSINGKSLFSSPTPQYSDP